MEKIKIVISEEKEINEIEADFLVLKNLEDGVFGPEEYLNQYLNGQIESFNTKKYSQLNEVSVLVPENSEIKSKNVLLVGIGKVEDLSLIKLQGLYFNAFKYINAFYSKRNNLSILTVIHGIGLGFDKKRIFYELITALRQILNVSEEKNNITSVIINENGAFGSAKIKSYLIELKMINPELVIFEKEGIFLNLDHNKDNRKSFHLLKTKFNNAISEDKISEAIKLLENDNFFFEKFKKEIVLYKNWYKALKKADMMGTIGFEEKFIRKNKLIVCLMELIDEEN
ncbi:MAG: hypothetical protein R3C61_22280 [Bacteroidia bacterium]